MHDHEISIRQAYTLARSAAAKGNHPFGALLVLDQQVVLTAENTVMTDQDVTRHAELNLVSLASSELTPAERGRSILYTSTEPCAMCTGAIYWAGISTIVYGCSAQQLADIVGEAFVVPSREVLRIGRSDIAVVGPILEEEGIEIHQTLWPSVQSDIPQKALINR